MKNKRVSSLNWQFDIIIQSKIICAAKSGKLTKAHLLAIMKTGKFNIYGISTMLDCYAFQSLFNTKKINK